jgi:hypothetical protein
MGISATVARRDASSPSPSPSPCSSPGASAPAGAAGQACRGRGSSAGSARRRGVGGCEGDSALRAASTAATARVASADRGAGVGGSPHDASLTERSPPPLASSAAARTDASGGGPLGARARAKAARSAVAADLSANICGDWLGLGAAGAPGVLPGAALGGAGPAGAHSPARALRAATPPAPPPAARGHTPWAIAGGCGLVDWSGPGESPAGCGAFACRPSATGGPCSASPSQSATSRPFRPSAAPSRLARARRIASQSSRASFARAW